jgi:hypothetical protein
VSQKRYVVDKANAQIFFSAAEVQTILRDLAQGVMPGVSAAYALSSAADLFPRIEQESLKEIENLEIEA